MTREELLEQFRDPIKVLDKGHVRLVDVMGDDFAVCQAARVSYGKGLGEHAWKAQANGEADWCPVCSTYKTADSSDHCVKADENLIRYMMRHRHGTPFEACVTKFHIKMPMDAHRQHVRHRTFGLNEYSTRYSVAIDSAQQTDPREWRLQNSSSKQGSGGYIEDHDLGAYLSTREYQLQALAREVYEERLSHDVAKEQARKDLPLSTYTEYYWYGNLRNLLHYLSLRLDPHAQQEIRAYAHTIAAIVREWVPLTWGAFEDYVLHAHTFSHQEMMLLRQMAADYVETCEALHESTATQAYHAGEDPDYEFDLKKLMKDRANAFNLGSQRERAAFWRALKII